MSTLPTAFGEKVVMRILDNKAISVPLEALGFSRKDAEEWKSRIDQPHGILLVTWPDRFG
jgi:general secretion pathway protein E